MMNGFAVIIHFVGASLFIIPAQYVKAFQVSSLSAESANFSSTPPYSKNRTVLEIESNNENNVSTPTNSPLGNANVNASYTGSEQTAFSTTEGLKNNATPSFTQTEIPERFNTTATLPKTSNVTPSKEFKTTTTAENKQVKPERKTELLSLSSLLSLSWLQSLYLWQYTSSIEKEKLHHIILNQALNVYQSTKQAQEGLIHKEKSTNYEWEELTGLNIFIREVQRKYFNNLIIRRKFYVGNFVYLQNAVSMKITFLKKLWGPQLHSIFQLGGDGGVVVISFD
ncbi:uncharacterized protein LOC121281273 isoform X1 [Carcharodon carcharias]|uniref:uncharacterized protein LOC121281273 isoform X1 n=1 Tax=Carcharodon carcharias TaxID=13397 RepID=UPI001B7DA8CF|nr:uncharacterized protein LOC121281273 isoform X1 [Carcharodon carcharias]